MASKQEMIKEMSLIVEQHEIKKQVVTKILDDLDKKEAGDEHISGIAAVNELMVEIEELEKKHNELVKKIKG